MTAISEFQTLSLAQRNEIMASKKEIEQGLFLEHDVLDKEIKGWLKEQNHQDIKIK